MQPQASATGADGAAVGGCDLFLSYSRKDQGFVRALHAALLSRGIRVWVDWRNITVLAPDWLEEVRRAIEAANDFLFVISPDALNSAHCHLELQHAIAAKKRLAPVLCREISAGLMATMPDELRRPSWIVPLEGDLSRIAGQLDTAIRTDYDYVREHGRLLIQSRDWRAKGESSDLLLRGSALREAERWLGKSGTARLPSPTADQVHLIQQSIRQRRLRRYTYSLLGFLAVVLMVRWLLIRTDAYQISRVLEEAPALTESAADEAVGAWRAALINFGSYDVSQSALLKSKDEAVSGAPQAAAACALFEANQVERGMQTLEAVIDTHFVSGARGFFPPEIPVQIASSSIPAGVERARQAGEPISLDFADRLGSAKDLLDKHDVPFAKHVFEEALESARQTPNRITRVATLAAIADVVKTWPSEFRESAVYAAEIEADADEQEFILSPIWMVMARAAVRAGKEDRARSVLSKQIGAAKHIANAYIRSAALTSLIQPLHLVHDPAEEETVREATSAVLAISAENLRAAGVLRLSQALAGTERKRQAAELAASQSKTTLPVISLESALAESRIGEAWAAIGNPRMVREHVVRAAYAARLLKSAAFRSAAYSAAGLSAARTPDRNAAFYFCEQAWRAASALSNPSEKDRAYGRVVRLLAELHDVSNIGMDVMSESIRKVREPAQIQLTEQITRSLLLQGYRVPTLLLLNDALEYSVSAHTAAELGHGKEALIALERAEDELARNPREDSYESRVWMHLAIALALLGKTRPAVEMANRCGSSSDRLLAFSGIVTAYAPRRRFGFWIWSGI
jgi:TIR domain